MKNIRPGNPDFNPVWAKISIYFDHVMSLHPCSEQFYKSGQKIWTIDLTSVNHEKDRGAASRKISSTKMNAESSRSHLILSILLEVKNKTTGAVNKGLVPD